MDSIAVHSDASSNASSVAHKRKRPIPSTNKCSNDNSKISETNKKEHKKTQYKVRQQKAGEFIKELKTARSENGKTIRKLTEQVDNMKTEVGDMKHRVDELEDERYSLIEDISTERVTNDDLSEQLTKAKSSRKNYKDNYQHQKDLNTEINEDLSKCNDKLELYKSEVAKWQHQANTERKKRKLAEVENSEKQNTDAWLFYDRSEKAKEFWKKQSGNMLHEFATMYSKWLQNYQNNSLENDLELPSPNAKKPRLPCYPGSPDSR